MQVATCNTRCCVTFTYFTFVDLNFYVRFHGDNNALGLLEGKLKEFSRGFDAN